MKIHGPKAPTHTLPEDARSPRWDPRLMAEAFECPHCAAYAYQAWSELCSSPNTNPRLLKNALDGLCGSISEHCKKPSMWYQGRLAFPDTRPVDAPNPDLPRFLAAA
jgi:hypothetical protein